MKVNDPIEKEKRHKAIQKLITSKKVTTQDKLVQLLQKEGFEVSQATISRDIKDLKLTKDSEKQCYVLHEESQQQLLEKELVEVIEIAKSSVPEGHVRSIVLRVKSEYTQLVAKQLKEYFSLMGIDLFIFIGIDGDLLITVSENKHSKVLKNLTDLTQKAYIK